MKELMICFILLLSIGQITAQKANIGSTRIKIEYANFPQNKVNANERNYNVMVKGDSRFNFDNINNAIDIAGWEYQEENAAARLEVNIYGFEKGAPKINTREEVKKDKDGNVTSRTNFYSVSGINSGKASIRVLGPSNQYLNPKKRERVEERENKKEAKAKKEKQENAFLKDVEIEEEKENGAAGFYYLNESFTYTTKEHKSQYLASNEFNLGSNAAYSGHLRSYETYVQNAANNYINTFYTYTKKFDNAKFKTLKTKKHPEYKMFGDAMVALKALLETKKFNEDYAEIESTIAPIMDYFQKTFDKYDGDDKHSKRIREACLYNLAQLNYYFDHADKTIEMGNQYLAGEYGKGEANDLIEKGEILKDQLNFFEIDQRIFITEE